MFKYLVLVLITITKINGLEDEYLAEKSQTCQVTKKSVECFKYRVVKYLTELTSSDFMLRNGRNFQNQIGPFRLIRIDFVDGTNETVQVLGELRQLDGDSEFDKVLKFFKRLLGNILQSYALKVPLPNDEKSVIVVDEDEDDDESINEVGREISSRSSKAKKFHHKKKKLYILFPLLVMLKLFKVKVLLVIILFGILVIKKALLASVLIVPQILSSLKACKHGFQSLHAHEGFSGLDYSDYTNPFGGNYNVGQGYGQAGGGYGGGGYGAGKEWGGGANGGPYERVYNAYKPQPS